MVRYFCHVCSDTVDASLDSGTPTCSVCQSDFVEEVDELDLPPGFDDGLHHFEFQGDNAAMATAMFNMLSQSFMPPPSGARRSQQTTEHQGHESGDRNVNEPQPFGNFSFSFQLGGPQGVRQPEIHRQSAPGDDLNNPMLRGIAALLADQFGNEHPLQALFGNLMSGNPGDYVSENGLNDLITRLMEETNRANAPPPASADEIESLPQIEFVKEKHGDMSPCAICQDEFEERMMVSNMPCDHLFHKSCLEYWLKINGNCPTCRMRVDGSADSASHTSI